MGKQSVVESRVEGLLLCYNRSANLHSSQIQTSLNRNDLPFMNTASPRNFNFHMPTRVTFGPGCLSQLPVLLEEMVGSGASVFLVTGRQSLNAQGALDRILGDLRGFKVIHYDGVLPFPSPELVDEATTVCRRSAPDIVVAVGGGSVLDLGKLVAALVANPGPSVDYGTGSRRIQKRGMPFIAVPTTSGSSSEVTSGAALWRMNEKAIYRVHHPLMFPKTALVDPDLTMSMSRDLAAATGMDAFTSAFESYWSLDAQPLTDGLALQVIRLYARNLEASCRDGERAARIECSLAATLSGIGYTNSRPNICHAFSRPLTLFWGVPHGQAVGVTLPTFLAWNSEAIPQKLPALWDALEVRGPEEARERLENMMAACGLPTRLGQLRVVSGDLDLILDHIIWPQAGTAPRSISREEAGSLLEALI